VPLRLHEDVDEGAIIVVLLVELGRHSALEEGSPLLNFFREFIE
jgi:hypothetical protein